MSALLQQAKHPVTAALAGPYGHPFHPILVTVPIGAWVASLMLRRCLTRHRPARIPDPGVGMADRDRHRRRRRGRVDRLPGPVRDPLQHACVSDRACAHVTQCRDRCRLHRQLRVATRRLHAGQRRRPRAVGAVGDKPGRAWGVRLPGRQARVPLRRPSCWGVRPNRRVPLLIDSIERRR